MRHEELRAEPNTVYDSLNAPPRSISFKSSTSVQAPIRAETYVNHMLETVLAIHALVQVERFTFGSFEKARPAHHEN